MQPPAKTLPTGTLLQNRYQIHALLGQGGMSRVYLATDLRLNLRVAVKENLQSDPQAREQFSREAQILARLSHPNLPRVIDHFDDAATGRQYLVMDFVEGEDLAAMVKRRGALPETSAVKWVNQVLAAVEYLHKQQPPVIHRDIKPSNIKITPQGEAVLVDFGIAKTYELSGMTLTGARAATPGYAPPEQYGMRTDQRSDIYAIGATLYTLVTGQVPPESTLRLGNLAVMPPPRQYVPNLSPQVERAILTAMELDTTRRFPNAAAFRAAFVAPAAPPPAAPTQFAAGVQPTQVASTAYAPPAVQPVAHPAAPPVQPAYVPPAPPRAKSNSWLWGVVGAVIALVVIAVGALAVTGTLDRLLNPPAPTAVTIVSVVTATAAPTAVPDFAQTQDALAGNFNTTLTAQAGSFQGTQTAQAPTATPLPTSLPPPTPLPPTTTTRPTQPPAPTRTVPPPTTTPYPTLAPASATPTYPPALVVESIRMDPADPRHNQQIAFYVTFRNTFTVPQQRRWAVYVYRTDDPRKSFWGSNPKTDNLPLGSSEQVAAPTMCVCGPGGPVDLIVYVRYVAPDGAQTPVEDPNGRPAALGFTVK